MRYDHLKRCARCRTLLTVALFAKKRSSSDGLQGQCRACRTVLERERRNRRRRERLEALPGPYVKVPAPSLGDPVSKPTHYNQGGVECIAAIEAAVVGLAPFDAYLVGNAIKYTWRHSKKNGNEDLFKAIWHLQRLAEDRLKRGDK